MGRGLLIFNKWSGQYDFRKPHSYFLKLCLLFCGFHFFHELKELRLCWQHYQNMSFLHKYTFSSQVNYKWITFLTFPHIFADCFKTLEISFVLFFFLSICKKGLLQAIMRKWSDGQDLTFALRESFYWRNCIRLIVLNMHNFYILEFNYFHR